ncbi:NF038120 family PEP-CTERM protein [Pseudoduganella violaceinigra]|uniref:NF038120 family PEP-CTERM protein n=1 Tax=Pseudoduganella violaceinigra TaxID=246602 RepID=UPI0003FD1277|nr:NF038120 family PEP-CTERM protein [Pseudoduganella violaceinigra]
MQQHFTRLKKLAGGTLLGAAAVFAAPAHASVASFDGQAPMVYNHGEKFQDSGLTFTSQISAYLQSQGVNSGMGGAILDSNNPNSCGALNDCPTGGSGKFYAGLNDGSVDIGHAGGFFSLNSLRFAFFTPLAGLENLTFGQLVLNATTVDGTSLRLSTDFAGQDEDGHFMFSTWKLAPDFKALRLSKINLSACLYDGNGGCFNMADWAPYAAQFAIDDLDVNVPLPGSVPLLLLGLAGLAAIRRRAH